MSSSQLSIGPTRVRAGEADRSKVEVIRHLRRFHFGSGISCLFARSDGRQVMSLIAIRLY